MITTQHLKLVPLTLAQLEKGLVSVKELARELNVPLVENLMTGAVGNAVAKKIKKMHIAPTELHLWYTYWLIIISDENIGAGMVGFKGDPDVRGEVEIGYGIDPIFQGCGYMTEAVRAMLTWAFSSPECKVVTAPGVLLNNYASQKVLVKTGFIETNVDEHGISYRCERPKII